MRAAAPGPPRTDLHSGPTPPRPVPDSALPPPVVSVGPGPGAGRPRGRGGREPRRLPAPPAQRRPLPQLPATRAAETEGRRGLGKNGPEESSLRRALPRAQTAPRGTAEGAWGALAQGRAGLWALQWPGGPGGPEPKEGQADNLSSRPGTPQRGRGEASPGLSHPTGLPKEGSGASLYLNKIS